jgi:hypothetical protein
MKNCADPNDGQQSFPQPSNPSQPLFRSSVPALRSFSEVGFSVTSVFEIRIRVHLRSSAVKTGLNP